MVDYNTGGRVGGKSVDAFIYGRSHHPRICFATIVTLDFNILLICSSVSNSEIFLPKWYICAKLCIIENACVVCLMRFGSYEQ